MILTIVIPLYNKEKYIIETLNSILKEITQEVEVIIIDDCSTDRSIHKVEEYLDKNTKILKNIKVFKNIKNRGVSATRNRGIQLSIGKYVMFLDADDKLKENFYKEILPLLQNEDLEMICLAREYSSLKKIEIDYKEILPLEKIKISNFFYEVKKFSEVLDKKIFLGGSGEIITTKKLIEKERFNEKISIMEDYDFYFKILNNVKKVYFYTKPLVIIEDYVENSLSSKKIKYENCDKFKILENVFLDKQKRLKQKIFWILMYSNLSRLDFKDRIKLLKREKKNITRLFSVNKYSVSSFFMTVGIDLNKIRRKLKNGKYRIKYSSSNI